MKRWKTIIAGTVIVYLGLWGITAIFAPSDHARQVLEVFRTPVDDGYEKGRNRDYRRIERHYTYEMIPDMPKFTCWARSVPIAPFLLMGDITVRHQSNGADCGYLTVWFPGWHRNIWVRRFWNCEFLGPPGTEA